jgi:hypothetical protein
MSAYFRTSLYRFTRKFAGTFYLLALLLIPVDASAQVSVWTNHNDNARTGANLSETILNTLNVNVNQFGKLFAYSVDASVYSQPLYIPNVAISGVGTRNVLYIATMNDSVYAFDADATTASQPLWMVNFTNPGAGITPVPSDDVEIASTSHNISGPIGIEGTPVIDQSSKTMYFVARTKENGAYFARLHAIDITNGTEKFGGPVAIQASVPSTTGYDVVNGTVTFGTLMQNQRPGLALANGMVLVGWASHGGDVSPFHGWLMAYDAQTLHQVGVFNSTPNGGEGGIWMSGQPPAVDLAGNVYFSTGNGDWDSTHGNFAQSVIQLSTANKTISLSNFFTPSNWASINVGDQDLGVTGDLLIPNTNLLLAGSKAGDFYLLNTANLGGIHANNSQIPQDFVPAAGHTHGAPVYWNSPNLGPLVYIWPEGDFLKALHFNGTIFDTTPAMQSTFPDAPGMPGAMLSLSASGSTAGSGILWTSMPYNQDALIAVVPGIFRAFDATDVTKELWNTHLNLVRDDFGNFAKFCPPTVANGRVYLATFSNQVVVYGLLSTGGGGGGGGGVISGPPGLTGTLGTPAATQNLTTLGTSDWAHWGLNSATSFDHKSGLPSQISNYTTVNAQAGSVTNFSGSAVAYTWSDGTPDANVAGTTTGVYISGQNKGFQIQVPADTSTRALTIYLGVFNTTGKLVAHLSDNSGPDYVDTSLTSGGSKAGAYTLTYTAASIGQTLTVTFTQNTVSGNVNLQAATLQMASAATPDFSISAAPATQTVSPGGSTTFNATITALNNFSGSVTLSASGLPTGASASFNPPSVTGSGTSTGTITTSSNTPVGSASFSISGSSGALNHSASVSLSVSSGTSGSGALSVDFVGSNTTAMGVSETAGVVPKTHWNNASNASATSPLSLVDENGTSTGAAITWKADSTYNSSTIPDQAGNFRMMRGYLDNGKNNPTTMSVTGLSGGTYDIYVYADAPNGSSARTGSYQLSGPGITTTAIGLTDAANTDFTGTFVQANNSAGNYVKFSSVPATSFTLTATPTQSPDYLRAPVNGIQIIPVAPPSPDFTISSSPGSQTINSGAATSYSVSISALNSFTGVVNFGVSGLPTGATPTFTPSTITGSGSTTLNIATVANTSAATYPLVITATSGNLTHTSNVSLVVNVPDFSIAATPSSQSVTAGATTTYTATVSAIAGFNGSVNLSATGLPNGASGSFSPGAVAGSGTSTLTITTSSTTPAGASTLIISGASGALSHSVNVTLNVATVTSTSGAIGINFVGGTGTTPMAASEIAGVVAKSHWNNAAGASSSSALNLLDENGTTTNASVSWVADGTWTVSITDQPGNYRMMKGYLDTITNPTSVTVSNLNFQTYDVYVYVDGDNGATVRTGTYQISGPGITTSTVNLTDAANTNFSGTFTQANNSNGNYVKFASVTTSSFTITATGLQSSDPYIRAPLNGIQVVPVAPAQPDFSVSATPSFQNVAPGNSTSYTITVSPLAGFAGTVGFSVGGLPTGSASSLSPTTVSNGSGSTTLGITVATNTPIGNYPLVVTATATSGSLSHAVNVSLNIGSTTTGPMLKGAYFIPTTVQNLTALGTSDWAHWGLNSNTSFDHKAGVTSQISNYTVINGEVGNLAASADNSLASTWTDGTPDTSVTATQSGVYIRKLNAGYQITAPAGKALRLLTLYVGLVDAQGKMTAHLSDGSAPDFVDTSVQNGSQLCAAYTLVYSAASEGQTITVSWTQNTAPYFASDVTLVSATLSLVNAGADFTIAGGPSTQSIPPGGSTSYALTVAPMAGFGGSVNLSVSGLPNGAAATFTPAAVTPSGMSNMGITASTSTPPGQYSIVVTATSAATTHSIPFTLNILNGSGPYVGGSFAVASAPVNLSAQGTADWAHWGLNNSTSFDHKAGVPQQISNYSVVQGEAGQVGAASAAVSFSWTGGTPDTSSSGTFTSVYIKGLNFGFQITVPADTTARTLTFYPGVFNTQGLLTAHISDGSSPDYIDTSLNSSGLLTGAYTISYKAASSGQKLTVKFTQNTMSGPRCAEISGVHCFVILQSATLAVSPPNFALSVQPSSQTVTAGTGTSYTASVAPLNGFTGTVNFTAGGIPSGSNASFSPTSLANGNGSSTLTVSVPQNTPAATYPLTLSATSGNLSGSVPVSLVIASASAGAQHYVAPTGSPGGDGTFSNPWDLQTALNQPASVLPGDTVWLRGGLYGTGITNYTSSLTGTSALPIVFRQYPGEHATINGSLTVNGGQTWYWGFEVANLAGTDRSAAASGTTGPANYLPGVVIFGPGTKFINMVVHDTAQGFSFWMPAQGAEIYGSLIYNNGWQGTDRAHGHGIYTENQTGLKTISDNILFQGFGEGIQCYGSSQAFVQNYLFDGNTIFNSGALSSDGDDYNLLIGGGPGPQNITVTNNYTYHTPSTVTGLSSLSWQFDSQASNLTATGNYWIGGDPAIDVNNWNGATFTNNTAYSQTGYLLTARNLSPVSYAWNNNTYYQAVNFAELNSTTQSFPAWQSATGLDQNSTLISGAPSGTWTFVRPNQFEPGRANITIYNWPLASSVAVDVSKILSVGSHYVVQTAQNFYGPPIVSGIYSGGTISVPMSGWTAAPAIGTGIANQPQSTGTQFGAFVVLQQ